MISYITKEIFDPWTDSDIREFENEGSQRDTVIYNSVYNSRMILSEENVFLCSIKQGISKYQNFYLFAVKRNMFYFIMYIPQMDIYRDEDLKGNKVIQKCLSKLSLTQKCISSYNGNCEIDSNISISDGTCFFIKVDANVEEFLFPRRGRIENPEIIKKYGIMNNCYKRAMKENEALIKALDIYDQKVKEKAKKRMIKFVVRKGIVWGVPALLGAPGLGALLDLDSVFGLGDIAELADLANDIPIENLIDIPDGLLT